MQIQFKICTNVIHVLNTISDVTVISYFRYKCKPVIMK